MKDNEIGAFIPRCITPCIDGGAGAALTNMIYDVTAGCLGKSSRRRSGAKVGQEPRATLPPNLVDSYQQLWTKPFDGREPRPRASICRAREKSDLGSILFDKRHVPDRIRR